MTQSGWSRYLIQNMTEIQIFFFSFLSLIYLLFMSLDMKILWCVWMWYEIEVRFSNVTSDVWRAIHWTWIFHFTTSKHGKGQNNSWSLKYCWIKFSKFKKKKTRYLDLIYWHLSHKQCELENKKSPKKVHPPPKKNAKIEEDFFYLALFHCPLPSRSVNLTARQSKSCWFKWPLLSRSYLHIIFV